MIYKGLNICFNLFESLYQTKVIFYCGIISPLTISDYGNLLQDEFADMLQSPVNERTTPNMEYGQDTVKDEADSESEVAEINEVKEKLKFVNSKFDIPESVLCIKYEKDDEKMTLVTNGSTLSVKMETGLVKNEKPCQNSTSYKIEQVAVKNEVIEKTELPMRAKEERVEIHRDSLIVKKESTPVKKEAESAFVEKGTVEIVDQNEPDTEMEDLSSPIAAMESDTILKQRAAEMRLEFSGSIAEIVNIASENEKSDDDRKSEVEKCDEAKSDDNMSIDEFDVEAQMMKITGDDGNDYKEKVDTSSERDKSMDGIEGLMESSKEDSDSEDKEMDDVKEEEGITFKEFCVNSEQRVFKEFETKPENRGFVDFKEEKPPKPEALREPVISSEESMLESTSSNIDVESVAEVPKIEFSIPPLSERIRKKPEQTQPTKLQLDFEASIIESTIEIEAGDGLTEDGQKSMLSSALRELLEAKIEVDPEPATTELRSDETGAASQSEQTDRMIQCINPANIEVPTTTKEQLTRVEETPSVRTEGNASKEPKRLKDPRTVTPSDMPAPITSKPEGPAPVKRKVRTVGMW